MGFVYALYRGCCLLSGMVLVPVQVQSLRNSNCCEMRSECILVREPKKILSKFLVYTVTQWALFKHSRILSMVPQATMASC